MPKAQATTAYLFPWYNNLQLNSQLRFGNVGNEPDGGERQDPRGDAADDLHLTAWGEQSGNVRRERRTGGSVQRRGEHHRGLAGNLHGEWSWHELLRVDGFAQDAGHDCLPVPVVQQPAIEFPVAVWERGDEPDGGDIKIHGVTQLTTYTLQPGESTSSDVRRERRTGGSVQRRGEHHRGLAGDLHGGQHPDELLRIDGLAQGTGDHGLPVPVVQQPTVEFAIAVWERGDKPDGGERQDPRGDAADDLHLAAWGEQSGDVRVSDGPVEVFSDGQNIIAALRVIYTVNNVPTSYSELMGLPGVQLAASYLFPWYNNLQLNSQLRFGVP